MLHSLFFPACVVCLKVGCSWAMFDLLIFLSPTFSTKTTIHDELKWSEGKLVLVSLPFQCDTYSKHGGISYFVLAFEPDLSVDWPHWAFPGQLNVLVLANFTALRPVQDLQPSWQKEVEQNFRPMLLTSCNLSSCLAEPKGLSLILVLAAMF